MPLSSFTLEASLTVTDDPVQKRAAQDVGQVGKVADHLRPFTSVLFHAYT